MTFKKGDIVRVKNTTLVGRTRKKWVEAPSGSIFIVERVGHSCIGGYEWDILLKGTEGELLGKIVGTDYLQYLEFVGHIPKPPSRFRRLAKRYLGIGY